MIFELAVRLEINRHQIVVVDIFNLPIGEPDVVLIGNHALGHLHAEGDDAIEDMKCVGGPCLATGQVDYTFRTDAGQRHPLEPFVDFLVIVSGRLNAQDVQYLGGSEANGIADVALPGPDVVHEFLEREILVQVGRGGQAVFGGRENGSFRFHRLAVHFSFKADGFLAVLDFAAGFGGSEKPQRAEILFDFNEVAPQHRSSRGLGFLRG
jgi:hypothetical protein